MLDILKNEMLVYSTQMVYVGFLYACTSVNSLKMFDVHGSVHRKHIFKYNQQDATLHNLFIYVKYSTCFRRFLRPSSGAHICIYSIGYFVETLLLPATVVEEFQLIHDSGR